MTISKISYLHVRGILNVLSFTLCCGLTFIPQYRVKYSFHHCFPTLFSRDLTFSQSMLNCIDFIWFFYNLVNEISFLILHNFVNCHKRLVFLFALSHSYGLISVTIYLRKLLRPFFLCPFCSHFSLGFISSRKHSVKSSFTLYDHFDVLFLGLLLF